MADQSDVEKALVAAIGAALFPGAAYAPGYTGFSAVGVPIKLYRGWPESATLDKDLIAGNAHVSVFPEAGQRNTTRYEDRWQSTVGTPTLSILVSGATATLSGACDAGQVAGLLVGHPGMPAVWRVRAGDTLAAIATGLAAQIPGASASGAVVTLPTDLVVARVVADGAAWRETRRQEIRLRISCWCPTPKARDDIAALIDGTLADTYWLPLADGSSARLRFYNSFIDDKPSRDRLWRRDLCYTAEYPTTAMKALPSMLFGVGIENGAQSITTVAAAAPCPLVGAIRWDAWYAPTATAGSIASQVAAALSPSTWNSRLPWFATVSGGAASWPAAAQTVMDAEIDAAVLAGLDYWAFDSFQPTDEETAALSLYLASTKRAQIGFCMLGQISNWNVSGGAPYAASVRRDLGLFGQPGYVKVMGGRPLYYVLDSGDAQDKQAAAIAWVRAQSQGGSTGNPYIVWLSGAHLSDYDNTVAAAAVGADAAGAYACPILRGSPQTYAALAADAADDWTLRAAKTLPMVPTAMAGWDQRPLVQTPQPYYPLGPSNTMDNYYEQPVPADLAAHVGGMVAWMRAHVAACPANVGLLYAWNEMAEGGWMMPTWQTGNPYGDVTRCMALGQTLRT